MKVKVFAPVGHNKYNSQLGRVRCGDKTCMTMCIVQNNVCLWSSEKEESMARVDIREDTVFFERIFFQTKLRLSFTESSMVIYLVDDKNLFIKTQAGKE
jgi:hypothetical protein